MIRILSFLFLAITFQGNLFANTVSATTTEPGYWETFKNSFSSFADYTWREITFQVDPWYVNYFWWLIVLSLVVWSLEIAFPWRKNQPRIRKDFWMDAFFMFFNFYIFKLINSIVLNHTFNACASFFELNQ